MDSGQKYTIRPEDPYWCLDADTAPDDRRPSWAQNRTGGIPAGFVPAPLIFPRSNWHRSLVGTDAYNTIRLRPGGRGEVLPGAEGGVGPYTYSLTGLPTGLSYDSATGRLTADRGGTHTGLIYRVRDSRGTTATWTFNVDAGEEFSIGGAGSLHFIRGVTTRQSLPIPGECSASNPCQLSVEGRGLRPAPAGFDIDTANFTVTATRTEDAGAFFYLDYEVRQGSNRATNSVLLKVLDPVTLTGNILYVAEHQPLGLLGFGNVYGLVGLDLDIALPRGQGGGGRYTYAITPQLPPGIRLESTSSGPRLVGRFEDTHSYTRYRIQATDQHGFTSSTARFSMGATNVVLGLDGELPTEIHLVRGQPSFHDPLPAPTGGFRPYTYTAAAPPGTAEAEGLSWDESLRRIVGTPTTEGTSRWTVTLSDAARFQGVPFNTTIDVIVHPSVSFVDMPEDLRLVVGGKNLNIELPEAQGSYAEPGSELEYTYFLQPALPSGLIWNRDDRTITGTPDVATAPRTYTYSVVAEYFGDRHSEQFTIEVRNELSDIPTEGQTRQDISACSGRLLQYEVLIGTQRSITLPAPTGGYQPYTYYIQVDNGNGTTTQQRLGFDPALNFNVDLSAVHLAYSADRSDIANIGGRTLTMTPTQEGFPGTPAFTIGYLVVDDIGNFVGNTFCVARVAPIALEHPDTGVDYTDGEKLPAMTFTVGTAVNQPVAEVVPNTGGTASDPVYSVTSDTLSGPVGLPAGLRFDSSDGYIKGTPTVATRQRTYELTVTGPLGSTFTVQFDLTVNAQTRSFDGVDDTKDKDNSAPSLPNQHRDRVRPIGFNGGLRERNAEE